MSYAITLALFAATAAVAKARGFDWRKFFLAGGPVGLGALALLPAPKGTSLSESARARKEVGDKIGVGLSVVTAVALAIWWIF